jgi:hypothetical protein
MKLRRLAVLLCVATVGFAAVGCGGDDSSSNDSTNNAPNVDSHDQTANRAELAKVAVQLGAIIRHNDAEGFCEFMEPSAMESAFGSVSKCAEKIRPYLKQTRIPKGGFRITNIQFDGDDKAAVTFAGQGFASNFAKVDGKWYAVATPGSEVDGS